MKKEFWKFIVGAILAISLSTGAVAGTSSVANEQNQKKEKVRIVVVEKKENGKSGSKGESQKPRPANNN